MYIFGELVDQHYYRFEAASITAFICVITEYKHIMYVIFNFSVQLL